MFIKSNDEHITDDDDDVDGCASMFFFKFLTILYIKQVNFKLITNLIYSK